MLYMEQTNWSKIEHLKRYLEKKSQMKEIFYENIFEDRIVIIYSFNLISLIQTFQWIRKFNPAKAGFFEVK